MTHLTSGFFSTLCHHHRALLPYSGQNCILVRCMSLATDDVPVIQFPIAIKRKMIHKHKARTGKHDRSRLNLSKPGKLLISCDKRKEQMHTTDYVTKFNPPIITSSTWTSTHSPGRHFTIHPVRENPSFKTESTSTFEDFSLSQKILDAIKNSGFEHPTIIQIKSIPEIMKGNNVMLAAETGSGKTFAYLLPVLQRLISSKEGSEAIDGPQQLLSPRTLILTPTVELTKQVVRMAKSLNLPITYQGLHSSSVVKYIKEDNVPVADVLVSTPVALLLALRKRKLDLGCVEFVVLDECDTLLDDSFAGKITNILQRFNINKGKSQPVLGSRRAQLILCSATYPKYAQHTLADIISMDQIVAVRSGYLHRISPHVKHHFLRVKPAEKTNELVKLIENCQSNPTIIFCNFQRTVGWLYRVCQENAIPAVVVSGDMKAMDRRRNVKEFQSGEHNLMVTTDILSRGLDTKQVKHVINFEVPSSVSDYLHRSGRVGRVGQDHDGTVTTFVSKKYEVPIVMQIEEAARRREELGHVSANIKRQHTSRWERKNEDLLF